MFKGIFSPEEADRRQKHRMVRENLVEVREELRRFGEGLFQQSHYGGWKIKRPSRENELLI